MTLANDGVLQLLFDADPWNSTISFQPGIPVTLGGTFELMFATDVDVAQQVGRAFDVFNRTGVNPTGQFEFANPYAWDLTKLYTTGEVTLNAAPEPAGFVLVCAGLVALAMVRVARRRVLLAAVIALGLTTTARADIFHWDRPLGLGSRADSSHQDVPTNDLEV